MDIEKILVKYYEEEIIQKQQETDFEYFLKEMNCSAEHLINITRIKEIIH